MGTEWKLPYLTNLLLHIHKTGLGHPLLMKRGNVHRLSKPHSQIRQRLDPIRGPRRFLHRIVIAVHPRIIFLHFQPAPRLEVLIRLAIKLCPASRAAAQRSPVYEIEFWFSKLPRLFEIVNVEFQIRRNIARLDGGEVCSCYGGAGIFVCEFDCPDAGPGADVEDFVGFFDGCSM
jgi:hypothetical protein